MKIKITITDKERQGIRSIMQGLSPFKSIFSGFNIGGKKEHSAISALTSEEKDKTVAEIGIAESYACGVLEAYAQHVPVIAASLVTVAASFRGIFMKLRETEQKWAIDSTKLAA